MTTPVAVSVVIPTFRGGPYLRTAIRSVSNQTLRSIEILVVSDGSPDPLEDVAAMDPRLRLIRQPNQGVSSARNRGIEASRGEYIAFLDDDDLWPPERLQIQYDAMQRAPEIGLSSCLIQVVDEEGTPVDEPFRRGPNSYLEMLGAKFINTMSCVMVRADAARSSGPFDLDRSIGEDIDFELRVARDAGAIFVDSTHIYYRRHANNTHITPWMVYHDFRKLLRSHRDGAPRGSKAKAATALGLAAHRNFNALQAFHLARQARRSRRYNQMIRMALTSVAIDPLAAVRDVWSHRVRSGHDGTRPRPVIYWFGGADGPGRGRQSDLPRALSALRPTALVSRSELGSWRRPVISTRTAEGMLLFEERFPRRFGSLDRRLPRVAMLLERAIMGPILWRHGFGDAILIAPTNLTEFYSTQRYHPKILDLLDPDLNGDTEKFYRWLPRVIGQVDAVLATAHALFEDASRFGTQPVLIPNGCSSPPGTAANSRRNGDVVFVGIIDQRVDLSVIAGVAERLPDTRLVLAGRLVPSLREDVETLVRRHSNLDYLGPIENDARQSLLEGASVGIIPFHSGWVGDRINSVKMYEYCAAGLPVVATRLAECERAGFVHVADTVEEFASFVRQILDSPPSPAEALQIAAANTWAVRAAGLNAYLATHDTDHEAQR